VPLRTVSNRLEKGWDAIGGHPGDEYDVAVRGYFEPLLAELRVRSRRRTDITARLFGRTSENSRYAKFALSRRSQRLRRRLSHFKCGSCHVLEREAKRPAVFRANAGPM
jgi:hypothetical protein